MPFSDCDLIQRLEWIDIRMRRPIICAFIVLLDRQGQSHPPTLGRSQGGSAGILQRFGDKRYIPQISMAKFMTIMIRNDDKDDLNIKRWWYTGDLAIKHRRNSDDLTIGRWGSFNDGGSGDMGNIYSNLNLFYSYLVLARQSIKLSLSLSLYLYIYIDVDIHTCTVYLIHI